MNDILVEAAQSFDKISHTNYEFTISKKKKIIITSISADNGDFTHIIGLDHLKDIWQFASHNTKVKGKMFRDILNEKYTYKNLLNESSYLNKSIPKTYNSVTNKEYTVSERISKVCQIDKLLEIAYTGTIYKWDLHKCNIMTPDGRSRKITINADYLLCIPSQQNPDETIYIFTYQISNSKDETIKLSILSAFADCIDLTKGQEHPYSILQETKEDIRTHQKELLYTAPSFKTIEK